MNIVADYNQPLIDEYFSGIGKVIRLNPEEITKKNLLKYKADALICRSTIKVNKDLLAGTSVKYVGTCTIGFDHVDLDYLKQQNIHFKSAPGCNSTSVSEYITAVLLKLAIRYNFNLKTKTIGIIGVGNVGSKVREKAAELGMKILLNDPPRERNEGSSTFCSLERLLQESDIVTIHVPLNIDGIDKTINMVDNSFIDKMKTGAFFINASRGKVAPDRIISTALTENKIKEAVLDVFATEPNIDKDFIQNLFFATEHISGHSIDGKVNGTKMIYRELCKFYNIPVSEEVLSIQFEPEEDTIVIPDNLSELRAIEYAVDYCYNITTDSQQLKENPEMFKYLRRNYPLRFEFSHYNIICSNPTICDILYRLGFKKERDEKTTAATYSLSNNYS